MILCVYNITLCSLNITTCDHNITQCSIIRYLSTTHYKEIEVDTKVEEEVEEDLEEAEIHLYVINSKIHDIMQENFHFHLRHACTVVQQTMIQRIVQHYWGRFKKREIRKMRMCSGVLQKPEMMGGTSKYSHMEELSQELMQ
jgi:hypothetical protein